MHENHHKSTFRLTSESPKSVLRNEAVVQDGNLRENPMPARSINKARSMDGDFVTQVQIKLEYL